MSDTYLINFPVRKCSYVYFDIVYAYTVQTCQFITYTSLNIHICTKHRLRL